MNPSKYNLLFVCCMIFLVGCKSQDQTLIPQVTDTSFAPTNAPTESPTTEVPTTTATPEPTKHPTITLPPPEKYMNQTITGIAEIEAMCAEYPMIDIGISNETGIDTIFNSIASPCYGEGVEGVWNLFSHVARQADQNDGHYMFVLGPTETILPFGILPGQVNIYIDQDKGGSMTGIDIDVYDDGSYGPTQIVELEKLVFAASDFTMHSCANSVCDGPSIDTGSINVSTALRYVKSNLGVKWIEVTDGQGNTGWVQQSNFPWLYKPDVKTISRNLEYPTYKFVAPQLSPEVVGFPLDWTVKQFYVKPCYVFTDSRFHAGDVFGYSLGSNDKIPVLAPTDGHLNSASWTNGVGNGINMETPFVHQGNIVFFDLVHLAELAPGIHSGMDVDKGQILGYLTSVLKDPGGYTILDIAARNNEHFQANPNYWRQYKTNGTEYFPFLPLIEDDLALMPTESFYRVPTCAGNPIP